MNIFAFQFLLIVNYCFHVDVDIKLIEMYCLSGKKDYSAGTTKV